MKSIKIKVEDHEVVPFLDQLSLYMNENNIDNEDLKIDGMSIHKYKEFLKVRVKKTQREIYDIIYSSVKERSIKKGGLTEDKAGVKANLEAVKSTWDCFLDNELLLSFKT